MEHLLAARRWRHKIILVILFVTVLFTCHYMFVVLEVGFAKDYHRQTIVFRHQLSQSSPSIQGLDRRFSSKDVDRFHRSMKNQTTRGILSEPHPSPIGQYLHPGKPLPNYLLIGRTEGLSPLDYHEGAVVFLHHNKAAGTTMKTCLSSMYRKNILMRKPIVVTEQERVNLNDRFLNGSLLDHDIDVFMGGYAFGLCRHFTNQRNCSYFTFLRDPVDRVISSYFYCMNHPTDQLCGPINVKKLTLQEWTIYQGSYFYLQLLVDPAFCRKSNETEETFISCWFKEKTYFAQSLTLSDQQTLLSFILRNLDKWFSVIGLTEEYETSLAMISHTYNYSFNGMNCNAHQNAWHKDGRRKSHSDREFPGKQNGSHEKTTQAMRTLLQNDSAAMKALEFDIKIYDEGKRLFQRQKKLFSHIND